MDETIPSLPSAFGVEHGVHTDVAFIAYVPVSHTAHDPADVEDAPDNLEFPLLCFPQIV